MEYCNLTPTTNNIPYTFLPFQLMYAWITRTHTDKVSPPLYCEAAKPPSYADCIDIENGPPEYSQVYSLDQEPRMCKVRVHSYKCTKAI